jgi:hypothetical protein
MGKPWLLLHNWSAGSIHSTGQESAMGSHSAWSLRSYVMKPRNFTGAIALVVLFFAIVLLCGCSTLSVEVSHVSHPLRGEPFGPMNEEDTLDTVGFVSRREYGRVYVEHGLAYRWRDGGFYGDDFIYQGRVGVQLWRRN